ncbi:MAG: AAA family ATPase, partial [Oscillospiraceae bacterium]|nr:AAA family ATPase [Oscillospiraceae bacterium]
MNSQTEQQAPSYPWYDDRVEELRQDLADPEEDYEDQSAFYDTPRKIYGYLSQRVWKQEEAKRAASIIMFNCLHGIKSNAFFVGPSGCGKTHTWRCLKQIFRDRIEIVDGSNLTQDGWVGSKKWKDLLRSPIFRSGDPAILVIDEADKMLAPKHNSSHENVSSAIQSEGLAMMEGTRVHIKDGAIIREVDTSKISFVFCGAFSNKAHDIAEKSSGARIGFGAAPEPVQPYARPLTELDLTDFGVMPEFMGRIQRIVNLQMMTADDYYEMTARLGPVLW